MSQGDWDEVENIDLGVDVDIAKREYKPKPISRPVTWTDPHELKEESEKEQQLIIETLAADEKKKEEEALAKKKIVGSWVPRQRDGNTQAQENLVDVNNMYMPSLGEEIDEEKLKKEREAARKLLA